MGAGDGEQRDVRDSLGELERRMLEIERELRQSSAEDAAIAGGAPPPAGAATATAPPVPAAAAAAGAAFAGATAAAPRADVAALQRDAQAKVDALRESLDGLTTATDRLRETAQTVVEDHGRTLVRLDRATAGGDAAPPPAAVAAQTTAVEEEPEAQAPAAAAGAAAVGAVVAAETAGAARLEAAVPVDAAPDTPAAATEADHAGETVEEDAPVEEVAPDTPAGRGRGDALPPVPARLRRNPRRRRRLLLLAALAAAALVVILIVAMSGGGGGGTPPPPAPPQGVSATRDALTVAGGGLNAIGGLRTGSDEVVRAELCTGRVAAAITVIPPGGAEWQCPGLRRLAAPVVAASGFARQRPRGRTCVSVPKADQLAQRADSALTARRAAAVSRADRSAAFAAGTAFDQRNGLTLLAGAPAAGEPCVTPTPQTLADGTYPLSTRLVLYATAAGAATADARDAAAQLRRYFVGTPPLQAIVLR